jgi:hypothetical protein
MTKDESLEWQEMRVPDDSGRRQNPKKAGKN